MLNKFSNYFSLFLLSIALITHILKLIYLLFKPMFMNKYFSNNKPSKIDLILYVNTEPDECFNRIIKRNRPEEINKISKDYLVKCHNKHLEWFHEVEDKSQIIHIDGHQPIENVMNFVFKITNQLILDSQNSK